MTDEESEALAYFVPTPLGRMLRRFFYPPYPSFRLAALRIGRVTDNTLLQVSPVAGDNSRATFHRHTSPRWIDSDRYRGCLTQPSP